MKTMTIIMMMFIFINTATAIEQEQREIPRPEIEEQHFPTLAYTLDNFPAKKQLTNYDFAYGITQLSTLALSIILFFISAAMLIKNLGQAWSLISVAGMIFTISQIFETLKAFNIYSSTIQYFLPSIIIGLLIAGILRQKAILKGCYK